MDSTFFQTAANSPDGMKDNRYFKTSEYQIVKTLRLIFKLLGMAVSAIITLCIDVIKGIVGKS